MSKGAEQRASSHHVTTVLAAPGSLHSADRALCSDELTFRAGLPPRSQGPHEPVRPLCRLDDGGDSEGRGGDARPVHPGEPAAQLPHLLRDARVHGGNRRLPSRVSSEFFPAGPPHTGWALPLPGPHCVAVEAAGKAERPDAACLRGLAPAVERVELPIC